MTSDDRGEATDLDLDAAIAAVYAGPADGFVSGRNELVRSLRAAGRTAEIAEVKALRKPKAVARALNAGVAADPAALDDLVAAAEAAGEAQEGRGDLRSAMTALRDAERAVTEAAGSAAAGDERPPPAATIGAAVRAVLADADALAALRAGRLVDVPSAGGFGLAGLGLGGASDADDGGADRDADDLAPATRTPRAARPAKGGAPAGGSRGRSESRRRAAAAPSSTADARPSPRPRAEPKGLGAARRAVADAEEAVRIATEAVAEADAVVDTAELDEQRARDAADEAARLAEVARDHALEVARVATNARREAAARTRRRTQAEAALEKATARLAKLDPS